MNPEKTIILKVLVGSRAHGLANKDSDYDYRGLLFKQMKKLNKRGV